MTDQRGSFVLEAKQTGKTLDSSGWEKAMLRAHNQADQYARALPADEGRPPFILVVDVGLDRDQMELLLSAAEADWRYVEPAIFGTLLEYAHRKRQQAEHPALTMTGMYNVLEKLRSEEPLTAKDKTIHEQGLVSVLRELHDELDNPVFATYGWDDLAEQLVGKPGATTPLPDKPEAQAEAEEELLRRLVELNTQRSVEEARGHTRWLRPEYQNPSDAVAPEQSEAVEIIRRLEGGITRPCRNLVILGLLRKSRHGTMLAP